MKKLCLVVIALALLGAPGLPPSEAQDGSGYRIVVNSANPTRELTKTQVSNFLLKKKGKWDHGVDAVPADLDSQSAVRAAMSEEIHGRSVAAIKNFWQRQIFSGRDVPPVELADDNRMLDHVRGNPGAIGYVSASAKVDGVKVVTVRGE
jgi:hypothetical protein